MSSFCLSLCQQQEVPTDPAQVSCTEHDTDNPEEGQGLALGVWFRRRSQYLSATEARAGCGIDCK